MAQPRPGEVFSHYRIDAPVGAGGMGQVFVATDLNLSRRVALKMVSDSLVSDTDPQSAADFRRRFHHEAEALAQLDCDHVIRIYEHGEFDGTPFIATQYVAGGELGTLLQQRGPMPPDRAALVCAQIAEALAEAHEVGIVHRDVKTSNVLIRDPDAARLHAVLCDFGIAHTGDSGLTATGAVPGTWAYLAPERAKGSAATPASDLYSLGCLFWACLNGTAPYSGSDVEVAMAHVSAAVPQLAGDDAATGLNQVLARLLAKEPADRYPDARAAHDALLDLAHAAPVAPTRVSTGGRSPEGSERPRRHRRVQLFVLAGIATVLVTALAAGALAWQDKDQAPDPGAADSDPGDLPAPERQPVRADFDGDGRSDLGINVTQTPSQSLFLPSSGTAFGSSQSLPGVETLPSYGDFDADGRADLAVFGIDDVSLTVDVTTASGAVQHSFPPITGYTVLPGPTGDFNGDGRTDLSIQQSVQNPGTETSSPEELYDYTFWVALSTSTGFDDPQRWLRDGNLPVATVADLDGDGDDDAVTELTLFSHKQAIHLSDGVSFDSGNRIPRRLPVAEMLPGDFDGDGTDELLRASRDHLQLLVYKYEDGKLVKSARSYSYGAKRYYTLVVGDFDGDGLDDVASYAERADTVRFAVSISAGDIFDDPVPWGTWTCGCQARFSPLNATFSG